MCHDCVHLMVYFVDFQFCVVEGHALPHSGSHTRARLTRCKGGYWSPGNT